MEGSTFQYIKERIHCKGKIKLTFYDAKENEPGEDWSGVPVECGPENIHLILAGGLIKRS